MITEGKINDAGILRVGYIAFVVVILFIQMFLYCYVGELITEKVSYMNVMINVYFSLILIDNMIR